MGDSMLEFTEALLQEIKLLRQQTNNMILNGGVRDMEQYKFLMGRLEGYKFVEEAVQSLLRSAES
jgi:23S rRNA A1618 N6-methylase RlmF